jgi:hypothetical protein
VAAREVRWRVTGFRTTCDLCHQDEFCDLVVFRGDDRVYLCCDLCAQDHCSVCGALLMSNDVGSSWEYRYDELGQRRYCAACAESVRRWNGYDSSWDPYADYVIW